MKARRGGWVAVVTACVLASPAWAQKDADTKTRKLQEFLGQVFAWKLDGDALALDVVAKAQPDFFGKGSELGLNVNYNWDGSAGSSSGGHRSDQMTVGKSRLAVATSKPPRRLTCEAGEGKDLVVTVEAGGELLVYRQSAKKVTLVLIPDEGDVVTASAASFEALGADHPSALATFARISGAQLFPLPLYRTHPAVIAQALRGADPIGDEERSAWKRLIERLGSQHFGERETATGELKAIADRDPRALALIDEAAASATDLEVKSRLEAVQQACKGDVAARAYVAARGLDHDLAFLAQLTGHPDEATRALALARLERVTGVKHADAAAARAWIDERKGALAWDAAQGVWVATK